MKKKNNVHEHVSQWLQKLLETKQNKTKQNKTKNQYLFNTAWKILGPDNSWWRLETEENQSTTCKIN